MPLKIVITGAGVISAAGIGWKETLQSLRGGGAEAAPLEFLDTIHKEIPCYEVPCSDEELRRKCGLGDSVIAPRSSLFGIVAAREAVKMAGLHGLRANVAFLNGTTVGGMDITERNFEEYLNGGAKDRYIGYHCDGVITQIIADALDIDINYKDVVSTACSAAANAIAMGAELIRLGRADVVVAGGTECITKYHLNGFNSLMILDTKSCRPFDAGRGGLNLGEGAGYLVLESEEFAMMRGASPLAELSGWGNACDAYHQTASSEEGTGAILSMRKALECARLDPSDIDYINAHGTGTPNNDLSEGVAIQTLFKGNIPPVGSTKVFTGHPTSAAAGVEAVISLIALREGFVPANLRFSEKIPELDFVPVRERIDGIKLTHVLSNSFGFGGNDSTLIFSAPQSARRDAADESNSDRKIYINGASVLCKGAAAVAEASAEGCYMPCEEPDYKGLMSPIVARRLGRIIKRTYYTAVNALRESGVKMPDAIITGTGLGCTGDTYDFLSGMIRNGEALLKPSLFINSTPNTVSSQIAIMLGCKGFNNTHVNDGMAFEGALLESYMLLKNTQIESVLLNATDETSGSLYEILRKHPDFKGRCISEGAGSFVLTHSADGAYASVDDIWSLMLPKENDRSGREEYLKRVYFNFLAANELTDKDIDAVYLNCLPDEREELFPFLSSDTGAVYYKTECGEYLSASGYGFCKAARRLRSDSSAAHAVSISQSGKREYSFVLMSRV